MPPQIRQLSPDPVREARSKRHLIRLLTPIEVVIAGEPVRASDWSPAGFGVNESREDWRIGAELDVWMALPLAGGELRLDAKAVIVFADRKRTGFRFVDLMEGQAAVLGRVAKAHLDGRTAEIDELMGGDAPLISPSGVPPVAPPRRTLPQLAGYGALLALGLAVSVTAVLSLNARLFSVKAEHAAVTAPVLRIRAPAAGVMAGTPLDPGDPAPPGLPLFEIGHRALDAEARIIEARVRQEEANIEGLRRRAALLADVFRDYRALAEADRIRADSQVARAATAVAGARSAQRRLAALHETGHAPTAAVEETERRLAESEQELRAARAARSQADSHAAMAAKGNYYPGSRAEGGETARLAAEIVVAERAAEVHRRRFAALAERIAEHSVLSPCDCVIHEVLARPGERLEAGDPVHLLRARRAPGRLAVKVHQDEIRYLLVGGPAVVRLADRTEAIDGRIRAISQAATAEIRAGLPPSVAADQRFATIEVALPASLASPPPGLPAQVRFPIAATAALFDWFGLR